MESLPPLPPTEKLVPKEESVDVPLLPPVEQAGDDAENVAAKEESAEGPPAEQPGDDATRNNLADSIDDDEEGGSKKRAAKKSFAPSARKRRSSSINNKETESASTKKQRKSFAQRIEDLRAYKKKHGDINVKEKEDKSLYGFCKNIRSARNNPGKRAALTDDQIASLDALGFDWPIKKQRTKVVQQKVERKSFAQRIDDLKAYKEKHGHVNVKWNEDKSLYVFCNNMRKARNNPEKSTTLVNEERIASLDALGFEWTAREYAAMKSFEQRIADLQVYKEKNGHVNAKEKEDKSLYDFCRHMRQARKNPGKSAMALTDDRIATLDALGFDWNMNSDIKTFEQRLSDLHAYKELHGHVNVKEREDKSLYTFCKHTRYARNNPGKSGVVAVTDDRIAGLDELGFDWSVGTRKKAAKKSFEQQLEDSVELLADSVEL